MDKQEQIRILLDDMRGILSKRIGDISHYTFRFVHDRTLHVENLSAVTVIFLSAMDKDRMFEDLTNTVEARILTMAGKSSHIRKTTFHSEHTHIEPVLLDRLIEQTFEIQI